MRKAAVAAASRISFGSACLQDPGAGGCMRLLFEFGRFDPGMLVGFACFGAMLGCFAETDVVAV